MNELNKNNILVTGANGFVGKSLVKELLKLNQGIFLVSRDESFKQDGAKIFYGDLSNKDFCKKIVEDMDTVYYLAGYKKNISYHLKNPNDFVIGNVEPLIAFLSAVKDSRIRKIIYLSSTNVGLYKEGEEDGYVVGKFINELILKSFARQTGIDVKILRSAGVYGPGDNFNPETANFIPSMINKIYESENEISVWGAGKREIQFVYIDDLVSNLIEAEKSDKNYFVVGNPESLTINEITSKLIVLTQKDLVIKNDLSKPDKPSQLFEFSNAAETRWNLENGLRKTLEYYKQIK